jgi:hypothetical protein
MDQNFIKRSNGQRSLPFLDEKKYYGMQTKNCMRQENEHAPLL